MRTFIFACVHNAGRSQMSAAFFNRLADLTKARAISAGTQPGERVHPVVVEACRKWESTFRLRSRKSSHQN
jgi:arsenate reductase (thioredoxin)